MVDVDVELRAGAAISVCDEFGERRMVNAGRIRVCRRCDDDGTERIEGGSSRSCLKVKEALHDVQWEGMPKENDGPDYTVISFKDGRFVSRDVHAVEEVEIKLI